MPDCAVAVAAGPAVKAHALPLGVVAVPVPRALGVELGASGDLGDLETYGAVGGGGGGGGRVYGEEGEVSELCLEDDRRRVATGGVAEHCGGVGIAVVSYHGHLVVGGGGGVMGKEDDEME